MRSNLRKALAACVLLAATVATAEVDRFGLGDGSDGNLTVNNNIEINKYAKVTAPIAPGETSITVSSTTDFNEPDGAGNGDLVLILQTTGIVPPVTSGDPAPVDISDSAVGTWELARVASIPDSTTLTLTAPLLHGYAANVTQVIRVPEYQNVTLSPDKRISAEPWNGSTGGVVAFLATGSVTFGDGSAITTTASGFRGGAYVRDSDAPVTDCGNNPDLTDGGARRGEGIDSTRWETSGRGNVANGGGGGNCVRSGGGGGGNAGAGGKGGKTPQRTGNGSPIGGADLGGLGGAPLTYSPLERLTLGGGGGTGHGTSSQGPFGGKGGGLIFIRAGSITTVGGEAIGTIQASGGNGNVGQGGNDQRGASGGGAGGTLLVRVANSISCGVHLEASGGAGGDNSDADCAPGGGGGGGRVLYQASSLSGTCSAVTVDVHGGDAGLSNDTDPYGATAGAPGTVTRLPGGFPLLTTAPTVTAPTGLTNQPRPTVIGNNASALASVLLYVDGHEVGRVRADGTGAFSFQLPWTLSEGEHTAQAATTHQGVYSPLSSSVIFTVDTLEPPPPQLETLDGHPLASGLLIANAAPEVTGRAEADSTVRVFLDDAEVGVALADGTTGDWNFPLSGLTERLDPNQPYRLKAKAEDGASNPSLDSVELAFHVDLTPPAAPEVTYLAGRELTSTPTSPVLINDQSPLIGGTAEPGSRVEVTLSQGEVLVASATVVAAPDTGGWWLRLPSPLSPDGTYTLTATAEDGFARTGPQTSFGVDVDTAPPDTAIDEAPPALGGSQIAEFVFSGGGSYECSLSFLPPNGEQETEDFHDCTPGQGDNGIYRITTDADGDYSLLVRAVDQAGNVDPRPASHFWTVASTGFIARVTSAPSNPSPTKNARFKLAANRSPVTFQCQLVNNSLPGGNEEPPFGPCPSDVGAADTPCAADEACYTNLTDGLYTFRVKALDATNAPSSEDVKAWRIDATVPAAPDVQVPAEDGFLKEASVDIRGSATLGFPGERLSIWLDVDGIKVSIPVSSSGAWVRPFALADGLHVLITWVEDEAGNKSPLISRNFTIDTRPPGVSITSATTVGGQELPRSTQEGQARFHFSSDEVGVTFDCKLNGAPLRPCAPSAEGFLVSVQEGHQALTIQAIDQAGNASPRVGHEWNVDRTPPQTIIESGPPPKALPEAVSFRFTVEASEISPVVYRCSLDGAPFSACETPFLLPALPEGNHVLDVQAQDEAGNLDTEPAQWVWEVVPKGGFRAEGGGLSCAAAQGAAPLWALLALAGLLLRSRGLRAKRRSMTRA
jgi:hypothetical protein